MKSRAALMLLAWCAVLVPAAGAAERKVDPGATYGGAIFTGMSVGALAGAASGTLGYALERKNQGPENIMVGMIAGSLAGAVGLGIPAAAYEISAAKLGAAKQILFNTFGFSIIGGVVGAAGGTIPYRHKIGVDEASAEAFLGKAALGVLIGGLLGLGVGIWEGVFWEEGEVFKVPGKGIHAKLGLLELAWLQDGLEGWAWLPNLTLARMEF